MSLLAFAVVALLQSQLTTGGYNILVGKDAAPNLTTGSYNVVIGEEAGRDLVNQSCQIRIGKLSADTIEWIRTRYGLPGKVHFTTARVIEQHCGYPKGRVDELFRKAVLDPSVPSKENGPESEALSR